ncbi:MAG: response regulator [Verrucomicrobiota bacterium]|jgi:CheY-like chemotaxis protein
MNHEYLIVDDEPDLCWALENLLSSKGLPCQKAQTAQAALDLMKAHRFQLAFLDVTLPDMNGLELARRLRNLDPFLRVVIVSGYLSKEAAAMAQAQAEGLICACINKPFLHEEILRVIQDLAPADRARRGGIAPPLGSAGQGTNSPKVPGRPVAQS